jgi:two-component system, OmpR family, KDP operon response regulator KdpE
MNVPTAVILVVDDELALRRFLRASLAANGYRCLEAETAEQGLAQTAAMNPDLILLDLGLPDRSGVEVTRCIREWSRIPIIVISARGQETDKIEALDAGADDYLTKPFSVGELLARIRAALRRVTPTDSGESRFAIGEIVVDLYRRRVTLSGEEVHLTPIEYKLLTVFIQHAGRVLTHRQLLGEVWGPNHGEQTHYLRVYMGQLRHKLEKNSARPRYFMTEPGVGYRLDTRE